MCGSCCTKSPISILPHEDFTLRALADKYDVKYSSYPGYRVYDLQNRIYIALSYVIDTNTGACPFLSGNKCLIHYEYKPLICRSFPYVPIKVSYHIIPELKIIHAKSEYRISLLCNFVKNNEDKLRELAEKTNGAILHVIFEEQIRSAIEMDSIRNTLLNLLSTLWRRNDVDIVEDIDTGAPVVNLYDVLRMKFPELPYVLGINKILNRIT
uniref:YkgJ family cysteine cluster protein n=1 Tax=Staphylothermus marinus TaxID=2280 RepID=A0A7C4DAN2_STAMA